MLRRDACRNLSKMGTISALSSSLPFLFAQLKRFGRSDIESPSEQIVLQQINLSCEEISQIIVWCSLGDVVSKKSLVQDDFFSSVGLALQVLMLCVLQHPSFIFWQATYPDKAMAVGTEHTSASASCGLKVIFLICFECDAAGYKQFAAPRGGQKFSGDCRCSPRSC